MKRGASPHAYVRKLEARERARRRLRWLAGSISVVALGSLASIVPHILATEVQSAPLYREVPGEYLTKTRALSLFQEESSPILLSYEGRKAWDTLYRYEEFLALYPANRKSPKAAQTIQAVETQPRPASPSGTYGFRVKGNRRPGEPLTFQVLNFSPDSRFEFDFGSGKRQETTSSLEHTFDLPGVYRVDLWVADPGSPPVLYATAMVEVQDDAAVISHSYPPLGEKEDSPQVLSYEAADIPPSFPGGKTALYSFIQHNLRYLKSNKGERKAGQVHVKFTVDTQGKLQDPEILQSLGPQYDEEVLRILRLMPAWEPGEKNGAPVPVFYQLRVNFDWTP